MAAGDRRLLTRALRMDGAVRAAVMTGVEDRAIGILENAINTDMAYDELDAMAETDWKGVSVY